MSGTATKTTIERKLLIDEPSKTDKFSGGGHARTAKSLSRAIKSFRGENCAIGLEGAWGAGKSTIVELASIDLSSTDTKSRYHIFTFDLWSNQTEHFKRAFLETFIQWGIERFPEKKNKLEKKMNEVRSRRSTVLSDHYRKISVFGMLALTFIFFTPIIYAWLSPSGYSHSHLDLFGAIELSGPAVAQTAVISFLIILLFNVKSNLPSNISGMERVVEGLSKSFSIFNKEADKTETRQEVRDEDPTQYEFAKIFRSLLSLMQGADNTIVIVFDNIDRLPQNQISHTWAEVRAAINCANHDQHQNSKITSIVPYASKRVASEVVKGIDQSIIADDLFRKSFSAIFYVSPPILTEASEFFISRFCEGTSGHYNNTVATAVYRIFEIYIRASGRPPTPRQAIAFINDCTSYWVQWEGKIPIQTIAIFVAHHRELFENPELLRQSSSIDQKMIAFAQVDNIYRDLAALAYNVEPEMALQVLSRDPILESLTALGSDSLIEMAEKSPQNGFFELLPEIVDENIASWLAEPMRNFASVAKNSAALDGQQPAVAFLRRQLIQGVGNLAIIPPKEIVDGSQIWCVVQVSTKDQIPKLAADLIGWIEKCGAPELEKRAFGFGCSWIKSVGALLSEISDHFGEGTALSIAQKTVVPSDPSVIIGAAYDCDQTKFHLRNFQVTPNQRELTEEIIKHIPQGEKFWYAWPEAGYLFDNRNKNVILNSIIDHICEATADSKSDNIAFSFDNLWLVYNDLPQRDDGRKKKLLTLFESGASAFYAKEFSDQNDEIYKGYLAVIIAIGMIEFDFSFPSPPNPQSVNNFGNVQNSVQWLRTFVRSELTDEELIKVLAERIISSNRVGRLIELYHVKADQRVFIAPILAACLSHPKLSAPSFAIVARAFVQLQDSFSDGLDALARKLGDQADVEYWGKVSLAEIDLALLEFALRREESGWNSLVSYIDAEFKAVQAEQWRDALREGELLPQQLSVRNQASPLLLSVGKFYNPLRDHILEILRGAQSVASDGVDYRLLVRSLPQKHREQLPADVFARHSKPTENIENWIPHLGFLISEMSFQEDVDKSLRQYIIPLLSENSSAADEVIFGHTSDLKKVVSNADVSLVERLREILSGLDDDTEDNSNAKAERLRFALGIPPLQQDAANGTSGEADDDVPA